MQYKRIPQILLIAVLVLSAFGFAAPQQAAFAKAQPQLQELAASDPSQLVRVIAQKMAGAQGAEALVAELGGQVVSDLSIINAFAAEMTAEAALELAQAEGVRWVSLDAPVVKSGKPSNTEIYTVLDLFGEASYYNNDGSAGWKTPWIETDLSDASLTPEGYPASGDVFVYAGELLLSNQSASPAQPNITRAVDLSDGVVSAMLSYSFRIGPGAKSGEDAIYLMISNDGGQSYQTVSTLSFNGGTTGTAYRNILTYASADTRIRFAVASGFDEPGVYFALDNFQIEYEGNAFPHNTYIDTLNVDDVWAMGLDGTGIGVAIIDSGITKEKDLGQSVKVQSSFSANSNTVNDVYGHGTHVAGIVAMNGSGSDGIYYGIAPGVDLYSLKVNDGTGMAYESDVVEAIQWVYNNKDQYNIRVVNMSINSTTYQSYHNSPLDAAAEILWFNGVVVVASAGNIDESNNWEAYVTAPADDPFVITVGAADEKGTTRRRDDVMAQFSIDNETYDLHLKPEIMAPGKNIVSLLSGQSDWDVIAPDRVVGGKYFRLSGTSMAAPMVTGAVALLLQDEPILTPDQVKYRLINTAPDALGHIPYMDVYAAVTGTTTESANQGLMPSLLLATGEDGIDFASVGWNSVGWNSVGWNSVGWNSVGWNSVGWNSVGWNSVGWNSTFWGQ